ncbi:MAG: site-2 protease family protein [Candidatus Pacebacteria bacterium]|nr:site-2 protease family protein [Candidatus Paceibacterota bacterium]
MLTALIFIIVLAILIFVHELGHFLAARASGIRVDAFKLGFGPKIFAWKRGETEYGVNLIPFGGYVKIHGENPDEESSTGPDAGRSFVNKPRWKQIMVLVAGVTFNFVFAWILYAGGFMLGVTATSDGFEQYADRFTDNRVMITFVEKGSPAEQAGLIVGDVLMEARIVASTTLSGLVSTTTREGVSASQGTLTVASIQGLISSTNGGPTTLTVENSAGLNEVVITPVKGIVEGKYAVGIGMQQVGDLRLPFFTAIWEGLRYMFFMIRETAVGLWGFVIGLFQGTASLSDVSGPVGIAGIVGTAADLGFTYLIMITALISINLGVINLVPFPALDGGRVLFVLIEGVIRRRIPMKFTNWVNLVGFGLLMLLMVVITYRDIAKLFK